MSLLVIAIGFSIAGLVTGRWWVPVAAALTWVGIAVFLIANDGWEGAGWGDFGIQWNILVAVLTVAGAVIGVATNRLAQDLLRRSSA